MNRGITIGSVMITLLIFSAVSIAFVSLITDLQGNYGDQFKAQSAINNETDMEEYNESVSGLKENVEGIGGSMEGNASATSAGEKTAQIVWFGVSGAFQIKNVATNLFGLVGNVAGIASTTLSLPGWVAGIVTTAFGVVIAILIWRLILSETRI